MLVLSAAMGILNRRDVQRPCLSVNVLRRYMILRTVCGRTAINRMLLAFKCEWGLSLESIRKRRVVALYIDT